MRKVPPGIAIMSWSLEAESSTVPRTSIATSPDLPPHSLLETLFRVYDSLTERDLHHCEVSNANCCKPTTGQNCLLVTIKFACIECNHLARSLLPASYARKLVTA